MKIYKYPLSTKTIQEIVMPKNAKILSALNQREKICIWALVDPEEQEVEKRTIEVYATGLTTFDSKNIKFIDTVSFLNGSLIYHVFERKTEEE